MALKDRYGIQGTGKVEEINLNENPYTFEGTFKEFYGLVVGGRVKALRQNGYIIGISVSGYENAEADNLAGQAFSKAYSFCKALRYLDLATQLVEANLIPTIVSEDPLRITILNGLVTLNEYGEEVQEEAPVAQEEANVNPETGEVIEEDSREAGPTFTIDGVEYHIIDNPNRTDGRYHPMIARTDGEEVPNRKEIARRFLSGYGYDGNDFNHPTGYLERQVARILGE